MIPIRTILLVAFGLTILWKTYSSLRAHRLKEKYVLLFFVTGLPFLALALWPDGIVFLSEKLAIEKPTLMVLGLAAYLILLIFELLSIVSQQDRRIATLAQTVGLLTEREGLADRGGNAPPREPR
ncbi:MAG: DUF2304 domain-containing protein [Planctomycetota bacterium]|nr:DUF2304 domain-containing protein [Planctomycetota bacterium]